MSTLRVNTLQDVAGTGQPAMSGAAKAWVNFNGTGTVAIRASFNVSSITDTSTGDYTINFTTAMPDTNYAVIVGGQIDAQPTTANADTLVGSVRRLASAVTTAGVRINTQQNSQSTGVAVDPTIVTAAVFR